jgi:hypothetical protein
VEFAFIFGLFVGSVVTASFAAWAAWHEHSMKRTSETPDVADYVTPQSLLERHSDVGRFCEWGGLAGPGAHVVSQDLEHQL